MSTRQQIHRDDLEIVALVVGGDEAAADAFARTYSERFKYLARRRGVPPEDCPDVAQEAMLVALDQMRRGLFRGEGQLGAWLARIINGEIANYWRKWKGVAMVRLDEPEVYIALAETLTAPMSNYELYSIVWEALQAMPAQHCIILLMKRTEDLTLEEISRMLGITIGQAGGRLYAAEEMFRRRFQGATIRRERPAREALTPAITGAEEVSDE